MRYRDMQTALQPPCERGRIRRASGAVRAAVAAMAPDAGDKRTAANARQASRLPPCRLVDGQLNMASKDMAPALTASSAGSLVTTALLKAQTRAHLPTSRAARTRLKSVPADAAVARLQRRPRPATRRASARAVCAASSRVGLTTRALTPGSPRRAARRARATSGSRNARVLPDPARRASALLGGSRGAGDVSTGQAPLPAWAGAGGAAR